MASLLDSDPDENPPLPTSAPIVPPRPSHTPSPSHSPDPRLSTPSIERQQTSDIPVETQSTLGSRWQHNLGGVGQRAGSYFSYPVKHTLGSAWKRISSQDAISTLGNNSRSENAGNGISRSSSPNKVSFSSLVGLNGSPGAFTPPQRAMTPPFQPPPLTPLSLTGYKDGMRPNARLLLRTVAEEIRLLMPPRLQLVNEWRLAFSLEQDGSSLSTLYTQCNDASTYGSSTTASSGRNQGGCVLVVKDSLGGVFGAYLTDPPKPSGGHYYGHGECFLWRAATLSSIPTLGDLPPPPSEDTTNATRSTTTVASKKARGLASSTISNGLLNADHIPGSGATTPRSGTSTPERIRFKAFPYSGENDYLIFCEHGFLSVGGGDGHYGLWLDSSLERGVSQSCPTFGNEPLSDESEQGTGAGKGSFEVMGVECWWVG